MKKLLFLIPLLICVNSFSQLFFRNDSVFFRKSLTEIVLMTDNAVLIALFAAKQNLVTTGTTAQYFRGDFSLATFPTTTAAFSNSTNKNFVTDAQATVIGNTSGTNSGDNAVNSLYSGLVSNANHTGDATGSTALTLATVNSNVGSFTNANITVNAKGLVTAASNGSGGSGLGYTLSVQALTSSPADGQTIYFGQLPKAPVTGAATSKIYIRKAGTIKMAQVYCFSGTAGTAEAWVMSIRVNNTTDTQISSVSLATSERIFTNSSLNIVVSAGDYIEIKCVNPTWVTNPLTTIFGGYIYIE